MNSNIGECQVFGFVFGIIILHGRAMMKKGTVPHRTVPPKTSLFKRIPHLSVLVIIACEKVHSFAVFANKNEMTYNNYDGRNNTPNYRKL